MNKMTFEEAQAELDALGVEEHLVDYCDARRRKFICTRPRGHAGDHVASGCDEICLQWPRTKRRAGK